MRLTIENYMVVEKIYISMMEIVDSEFVAKYAKLNDDKSIYDANDEKSTFSSCCWVKIYEVINCLVNLSRNYFEVGLVWILHVIEIKIVFQRK